MANSESIRYLLATRESVTGTLASTLTSFPFDSFAHTPKKQIVMPKEFRGVRVMNTNSTSGNQSSELKLKIFGYYDLAGWFLASAFNAPVSTAWNGVTLPVLGQVHQTGGNVTSIDITYGGSGMTAPPTITVTLGSGNTFTGVLTSGVLTSITIGGSGTGYTNASVASASGGGGSGTGITQHVFKTGGSSVPSMSIQASYGVGTANNIWEQFVGCQITQLDVAFSAEKICEMDVTLVSPLGTVISAPSIPAFSIANYVQPWSIPSQSVSLNYATSAKIISAKFSVKNNRSPLFTIQAGADPQRFIEGPVEIDFDIEADYTANAGSAYAQYEANTSPGPLLIQSADNTSTIGTSYLAGTNYPTFQLFIPRPFFADANLKPDNKGNTTVTAKGKGLYDTVTSSAATAYLYNAVSAYAGS